MRAFCSGLTRAKIEVCVDRRRQLRRRRAVDVGAGERSRPTSMPSVRHTVSATSGLSPVTTLTVMPEPGEARDRRGRGRAWAGRGRPGSRPARRSCSSRRASPWSSSGAARVATATTRLPAANSRVERRARASSVTSVQRSSTVSGAPLVTSSSPVADRRRGPTSHRRSWSNGARPSAANAAEPTLGGGGRLPERDVERVAADGGVPCATAASLQTSPSAKHLRLVDAARVDGAGEGDATFGEGAGLVREQDVDVAEVFDAHEALHEHLACGQPP